MDCLTDKGWRTAPKGYHQGRSSPPPPPQPVPHPYYFNCILSSAIANKCHRPPTSTVTKNSGVEQHTRLSFGMYACGTPPLPKLGYFMLSWLAANLCPKPAAGAAASFPSEPTSSLPQSRGHRKFIRSKLPRPSLRHNGTSSQPEVPHMLSALEISQAPSKTRTMAAAAAASFPLHQPPTSSTPQPLCLHAPIDIELVPLPPSPARSPTISQKKISPHVPIYEPALLSPPPPPRPNPPPAPSGPHHKLLRLWWQQLKRLLLLHLSFHLNPLKTQLRITNHCGAHPPSLGGPPLPKTPLPCPNA